MNLTGGMSEMLHIKHSGMEGSSLPLIGMYPLSVSLPFLPPLCCVLSHFSRVQLFVIPWTVACQAPLSMGFSRQEQQSGLPFPPPGDLPDPGIEPESSVSPALVGFFTTELLGKPIHLAGRVTINAFHQFKRNLLIKYYVSGK